MRSTRMIAMTALGIAVLAAGAISLGCGEAAESDPTPVTTFLITPAAGSEPSATSAPATSEPETPAATSEPGGATTIALTGSNNEFEEEELSAPAGEITVVFDNQDSGVVHNVHFFDGDDADAETVAETEIEPGPVEQTVTFTVEPGEYYYQCDAHPATMSGTLTVT